MASGDGTGNGAVPHRKSGGNGAGRLGLAQCARLWPHKLSGEGHFLALFRKKEREETSLWDSPPSLGKPLSPLKKVLEQEPVFSLVKKQFEGWYVYEKGTFVYAVPPRALLRDGLSYIRTGLLLGERKKGRFEPFQAFAMSLKREEFENRADFSSEDIRVIKYLKGETIDLSGASWAGGDGWCLVCVDGFPLGFAKRKGTSLKNKYHTGWRWQ